MSFPRSRGIVMSLKTGRGLYRLPPGSIRVAYGKGGGADIDMREDDYRILGLKPDLKTLPTKDEFDAAKSKG
jgi:hypothetical protein